MEVAAAGGTAVEAVAPVYTQQADHREEHTHTHTGASLDLERVEFADVAPAVTAFQEGQYKYRALRLQNHRIAELHRKFIVYVTGIAKTVLAVRGELARGQGIVLVATQGDDFRAVGHVAGHAVAAHLEVLERGIAPVAVVVTQVTELRAGHQHQVSHQFSVYCAVELPLVVLNPLVALGSCPIVIINILPAVYGNLLAVLVSVSAEQGVRRGELQRQAELRAGTRVNLLVRGVTRKRDGIAQVVGNTVVEGKVTVGPVGELVGLPAQVVVQDKIVVRPLQARTQTGVETEYLEHLVRGQDTNGKVGVRHTGIVPGNAEGRGLFTKQPRLRKAGA